MDEQKREISGITVKYSDGSIKELTSGCCVDLGKKETDMVSLAYGMVVCIERMGLTEELKKLAEMGGSYSWQI